MPDLKLLSSAFGFVWLVLGGGCPLFSAAKSVCEEGLVRRRDAAGMVCDDLFWEIRAGWPMQG